MMHGFDGCVSRAVLMGILSEVHIWLSELETDLSRYTHM